MDSKGVVPAATGSVLGFLVQEHHGLPAFAFAGIVFAALVFGLLSKWGRSATRDRAEVARQSFYNAGALFIVALVIAFWFDMDLGGAAITGLAVGLLGAWVLDSLESSFKERWKVIAKAIFGKN